MEANPLDTGMYIIDRDYRIIYLNEACRALYPELKPGQFCYQAIGCLDMPCTFCPIRNPGRQEASFFNDARQQWITASVAEMDLPQYGLCYNIQFRARREEDRIDELPLTAQSREVLAEFVQKSDRAGIIGGYCEPGFPLYYANAQMAAMLGYDSPEDLADGIGGMVANTIHPEDMPRVVKDLGEKYYPGMTYETTYRMPRKDGSWFWTVDQGKVVETDDGRLAIISICSDMTRLVEHQEELRRQNAHLRRRESFSSAALENMPGGYHRCSTAEGLPFTYVSDRFVQMLGWTREEIRTLFDNKYANLIHPDDSHMVEMYEKMAHSAGHGNVYDEGIFRMKGKNGYRWVQNTTMLVDLGEDSFFQGTIADITEHIEKETRQQEQLEQAIQRAEAANRAKSTFLLSMSHDLRTPMNAIIGYAALADQHYQEPQEVKTCLGKLRRASEVLLKIINDVLDLASIESGKLTLDIQPHHLCQTAAELEPVFSAELKKKKLSFTVDCDVQDEIAYFDLLRMNQVDLNLISNAIKYTPEGGSICYTIRQIGAREGWATYRYSVRDTGIGMSPEFCAQAFDAFTRERNTTSAGIEGTGLGLSITKRLLTQMGGSITCRSEPGKGSEFIYTVSFRTGTPADLQPVERASGKDLDLSGRRVLLVEDNQLNREIACELLQREGLLVETAEDGTIAVDMVAASQPGYFDLVLMDIQMPVMDGYEATRAIRRLPDQKLARIPIVAMTANAFEEDKKNALAAGMDDHLAKPINMNWLLETMARLLQKGGRPEERQTR